ncbi:hypothetical protein YC2023_040220 [Brassica napus]
MDRTINSVNGVTDSVSFHKKIENHEADGFSESPLYIIVLFAYGVVISSLFLSEAHEHNNGNEETRSVGIRFLLGFKETSKGSNITFECSP